MKTEAVDKIILVALFIITVIPALYLMHKEDLGDNEWTFIIWMQTQAALILGALINRLIGKKPDAE